MLIARGFVQEFERTRSPTSFEKHGYPPSCCLAWNTVSFRSLGLVTRYLRSNPFASSTTNPFGLLKPILQRELVVTTLLAAGALHYEDPILLHPAETAIERLLATLRTTYSLVEGHTRLDIMNKTEFYEGQLAELYSRSRKARAFA